ncbi:hypothetical protein NHX12_018551 [Muraenolepis orangiensis]|uniref:Uncharacterized protein n=1 Tax=Muraenolepis orangiensis TaxID=630683 RepID=A0A9Q0IVG1_9TELE|nr:hypothetical protein NHX12_018551 [Muraenolepis orangiensis]
MMEESKLTHFQRRQVNKCLTNGAALPPTCGPSSSAAPPKQKDPTPTQLRRLAPRPGKRNEHTCRSGDNYRRDTFRPGPTRDLEKEKRRLQSILATGEEEPKPKASYAADQKPEAMERDRFQEVLDEIEENRQFLADMTSLGQGKIYNNLINTEISQKIRELEMIDKTRGSEMRDLISEKTRRVDQ